MPERAIHKILTATEPADVAQMAMIECLRQIADGNKTQSKILDGMQVELRDVRERVIRIEATEVKGAIDKVNRRADDLEDRVDKLEAIEDRRTGALNLTNWVLRNWPAVVGYIVLAAIMLLSKGGVHL